MIRSWISGERARRDMVSAEGVKEEGRAVRKAGRGRMMEWLPTMKDEKDEEEEEEMGIGKIFKILGEVSALVDIE